ncbi:glycosyltransferase family 2 protein [bacterium]|nr:glycosyltransferase family 2 protein [bacterium]MBU1154049.1 glycosyltransferase family 2 protein [bacterium]MBU1782534.1 glycosyltransferase family 2 protein [bacterium]MBU2599383.1 glycosyltransferase family 2 protein [bacterium]
MRERLLILPVYNEEDTVAEVLSKLSLVQDMNILVVNDGSTDDTAKILDKAKINFKINFLINHSQNQGYGKSLIDGFLFAIENNYKYLVTMDCDGQHEPAYLSSFFQELESFDIVSGSRYLPNSPYVSKPPPDRLKINKAITQIICQHTKYHLTDSFCGFKGYRIESLKKLSLTEYGYGFPLQLWIQASFLGLTVKEVPVPLVYKSLDRNFKGAFSSSRERLKYYLEVIKKEHDRCLSYRSPS